MTLERNPGPTELDRQTARAARRPGAVLAALASAGLLLSAAPALSATFGVNSTGDQPDDTPGDGICRVSGTASECTLRAAIEEANATAAADVIEFSSISPNVGPFAEILVGEPLPALSAPATIDGYTAPGFQASGDFANPIVNLVGAPAAGIALRVGVGASGSTVRGLAVRRFEAGILIGGGVSWDDAVENVTIQGCHIGVGRGFIYVGNESSGVGVVYGRSFTIGRTCDATGCTGKGNVISANQGNGIGMSRAVHGEIHGNRIGTTVAGDSLVGPRGGVTSNDGWGIQTGGLGNHPYGNGNGNHDIGDTAEGGGNLISGNLEGGIRLDSMQNGVVGNRIGTDRDGQAPLGNGGPGIQISGAHGVNGIRSNQISGNAGSGFVADGYGSGGSISSVHIDSNTIGLSADGRTAIGNGGHGVEVAPYTVYFTIADNAIGGNAGDGIHLETGRHRVYGNWIGASPEGDDVHNGGDGIFVTAYRNEIGLPGQGNVIGFHPGVGLHIDADAFNTLVVSNYIGTNAAGDDLGNDGDGILCLGESTRIGEEDGLVNGLANVIGWNGRDGIRLNAGIDNEVLGNAIGITPTGDDIGNDEVGVDAVAAPGAIIGSGPLHSDTELRRRANAIGMNRDKDVVVRAGVGVPLRGNEFVNLSGHLPIDLERDGPTANDANDVDGGGNRLQNFPEFSTASTRFDETSGYLGIYYSVPTSPSFAAYPLTIDFYLRSFRPGEPDLFVGSDLYEAAHAMAIRRVGIPVPSEVDVAHLLIATATDAQGNTSELSRQWMPVPEPGFGLSLVLGAFGLGAMRPRQHR